MQVPTRRPLPEREYLRVGEVAEVLGVAPSAVRYWKERFAAHVRPARTRGDQCVFSRRDVTVLALARHLIQDEGLSIPDTRLRLARLLAENRGDVAFIELVPSEGPAATHGFLAEQERLRASLEDAERRAAEARAEVDRLRASLRQLREVVQSIAELV